MRNLSIAIEPLFTSYIRQKRPLERLRLEVLLEKKYKKYLVEKLFQSKNNMQ